MLLTRMCGAQTMALSSCVLEKDGGGALADGEANLVCCGTYGDVRVKACRKGKGGRRLADVSPSMP